MSEECSVAVGIRIRPFNDRERKLGAQLCVGVDGATTILQNAPEVAEESGKGKEPKRFTFDASFWSHDGFEELPGGYLKPAPGSKYADQQLVFETFGKKVLDNAWEGYHCCLFAYGQTGAGKSYSMVGYGANKGIVPTSCEEIFNRIGANTDSGLSYEVMVSMIEIYNEQVQDLLVPAKERPKKGLEIRESQQLGIYIDGVTKKAVDSYVAIEGVMEEGTENRTVGSTLMNATSSRAHTVITIEFRQISTVRGGAQGMKCSMINLVDLAGSEKAGQTGASGDRLKEGCAINKSLSALGNVIEKLADKATGKAKNVVIPYRDSKLTRLLQNALGGSSKTVMICAISPASSNYEETLSTLRYADRAKRIRNAATINENPQDRLIRQLREENNNLREMVDESQGQNMAEEMAEKHQEIAALEQALQEMQRSFAERLLEAQRSAPKKEKVDLTQPHIANLNEDDLLTNKLRFAFKEGTTRIGRAVDGADGPQVALSGPGLHQEHATVVNADGRCVLTAAADAATVTFVNGATLESHAGGVALEHGDRIVFGQCYFMFVDPTQGQGGAAELLSSGRVGHAMARKELAEKQGEMGGASEEELKASRELAEQLEQRVREAEEAKQSAQQDADGLLRQREEDFRKQMEQRQEEWGRRLTEAHASDQQAAEEQARTHAHELERLQREFDERQHEAEAAAQRRFEELEKLARRAAAEEEEHRQNELNMQRLEEQLMFVMPLVKETNLIAEELQRPQRLETKMHCEVCGGKRGSMRVTAAIKWGNVQLFEWSAETLENRVFLLRELLQLCEQEGFEVAAELSQENDPLWDPVEVERLIGVSQVLLEGLLMQLDHQVEARILSTEGHQAGTLRVEISPVARDGTMGIPDEDIVDAPEELLGMRMAVLVHVERATGLPEGLANDVRVEFRYFNDEHPRTVPTLEGHCKDPVFNFRHTFVQDPVTTRFLEYLKTKLVFCVYGRDEAAAALHRDMGQLPAPGPGAAAAVPDGRPGAGGEGGGEPAPDAWEAAGDPSSPTAELAAGSQPPGSPQKVVPSMSQIRRQMTAPDPGEGGGHGATESKACALL